MNVLLIGSGGREHALAWAMSRSPLCSRLLIAPGNPGTARHGRNCAVDPADHAAIVALCRDEAVDLVVVGPEAPLVAGLVDDLAAAGIRAFGPRRAAAALEGSKAFTRAICAECGIPGAEFAVFSEPGPALDHIRAHGAPIVVKADGLAAGKGVVVAETVAEAEAAVAEMFAGALGAAGTRVVIEECLRGEEASFFVLCDGETAIPLGSAQDHKRAYDGDRGPNTGGMGAYSPAPVVTPAVEQAVMARIVVPALAALKARGTPFIGVLFAGLMIADDEPRLIEFNVRFGDPECQVLMPRLQTDILTLMTAACAGALQGMEVAHSPDAALAVVMAAEGYPAKPRAGSRIGGLAEAEAMPGIRIFQAGTALRDGELVAAGGRVLAVTGMGATVAAARQAAYAAVDRLAWPQGFCRRDIGWRALEPR